MAANLKCVCCGLRGQMRELTGVDESGRHLLYGPACDACAALVWWAWFESTTNPPPDERALTRWEMRRQRAKVLGVAFHEPPPKSIAEREGEEQIAAAS